ncbi:MAG: hypothetical protein WAT92_07630 [Saprospiraceae bacterium]
MNQKTKITTLLFLNLLNTDSQKFLQDNGVKFEINNGEIVRKSFSNFTISDDVDLTLNATVLSELNFIDCTFTQLKLNGNINNILLSNTYILNLSIVDSFSIDSISLYRTSIIQDIQISNEGKLGFLNIGEESKIKNLVINNNSHIGQINVTPNGELGNITIKNTGQINEIWFMSGKIESFFVASENSKIHKINITKGAKRGTISTINNASVGNISVYENGELGDIILSDSSTIGQILVDKDSKIGDLIAKGESTIGGIEFKNNASHKQINLSEKSSSGNIVISGNGVSDKIILSGKVSSIFISRDLPSIKIGELYVDQKILIKDSQIESIEIEKSNPSPLFLTIDTCEIFQIQIIDTVFYSQDNIRINNTKFNQFIFENTNNLGSIFVSNLLPIHNFQLYSRNTDNSFKYRRIKDDLTVSEEGTIEIPKDHIHPVPNTIQEDNYIQRHYLEKYEVIDQPSKVKIIGSNLGNTQFINCNLNEFSHFEFFNSKIIDVFIAGSIIPEFSKLQIPIFNENINPIELNNQKRLFYSQIKSAFERQGDLARASDAQALELEAYGDQLRHEYTEETYPSEQPHIVQ